MTIVSTDDLKALAAGVASSKDRSDLWPRKRPGPARQTTFEALMYVLRQGPAALEGAKVREWLKWIDAGQLQEACNRVRRHKLHIAAPWADEDVLLLVKTWQACRGDPMS
jgi:hypothetical protein